MKKYNITVTEQQLRLIQRGLEAINRAHLKQYDYALEELVGWSVFDYTQKKNIRSYIRSVENLDMPENASYGIHCPDISDDARIAYDMVQVFRNKISWANAEHDESERHKYFTEYMTVNYDHPHKTSQTDVELPECVVVEDER